METTTNNAENNPPDYGSLWQRFGAIVVDNIVFIPVIYPLANYDITTWKSFPLYAAVILILITYKCFCEYRYGATIGKFAFKLKCVNADFQKITLKQALLRNSFLILIVIIRIWYAYGIFHSPDFAGVKTIEEYYQIQNPYFSSEVFKILTLSLLGIDAGYLAFNKQNVTLHDLLAKTFVIRVEENK